jgi:hypothetical protein
MTKRYQGSCHCGAIKFSFEGDEIVKGLRCNCSICSRKGAVMTPQAIPAANFHIKAEEGMLVLYQFGAKTAKHYFCKRCGIYPFHETARAPGHLRANLGCLEDVDSFSLEVELFDGKRLL